MIAVEPSWQDVLERRAALRRRRRARRGTTAAVVVAALLAAAPALGVDGWLRGLLPGKPVPVARLTEDDIVALVEAPGARPVAISTDRTATLRRFGLRDVRLVATRVDVAFYVVRTRSGNCFATGQRGGKPLFASVRCAPAGSELVDVSLQGRLRFARLAAFAFGRVVAVGIPGGKRYPVRGHVILLPHTATTAPLVGYDGNGDVVARSPARGRCTVKLYLQDPRTADLAAAIAGARGTTGVERVRYVSKALALGRMRRRYPGLTKDLAWNPLPASVEVTPTRPDDVAALARRLTAERLPGVESVKYGCVRR